MGPMNVAHDVRLTAASGAGTGAPELLQPDVAFPPIAPRNREFIADDFSAEEMERRSIGHKEKFSDGPGPPLQYKS